MKMRLTTLLPRLMNEPKAAIQQASKESPIADEALRRKRRENQPQVEKFAVVKEGPSLHQQTGERPSPGPEILAPQDQRIARHCLLEMRYGGGDSRTCNRGGSTALRHSHLYPS